MYFRLLHDERSGAVSYLLADLDAGEAVLVDPRGADIPVLNAMLDEHQLRLRWLLRTHEHDALLPSEAAALDALGAPRIQHHLPAGQPQGNPGAEPSHAVLTFGNEHVQVLRTPGHTPGCLSYLWRDRLFCGGLLAVDACPFQPRPALPEALWDSVVNDVFKRPAETLLFTGHATHSRAVSNVLEQRRWHPWFGGATRDEFLARVRTLPPAATASTATAQKLLGICSPKLAHAILSAEPDMGAMLPCGCGVAEAQPGVTRIALQDPAVIAAATDNADVHAACEMAAAALQRVVARLAQGIASPAASVT